MDFETAFHELLGHEGGYVNHPLDPGLETKWGVTVKVARANGYTGDMRAFPVEMAKDIYRRQYWDAVKADELPVALRYAVFDAAVNSGPEQAAKWLQRAVGTVVDGKIGPLTLTAANKGDPYRTRGLMLADRLKFMTNLHTWPVFGRGWARRIAALGEM